MTDTRNLPRDLAWAQQLQHAAGAVGQQHLDLIIDQTGWHKAFTPILKDFNPPLLWCSLLAGTPHEALGDDAPLLLRLDLQDDAHQQWLEDLIEHFAGEPRLLAMLSPAPFDDLARHLRHCLQITWPDGEGLLRFYDPRLIASVDDMLTSEQKTLFHGQTRMWAWLDRDGQPAWLAGQWSPMRRWPEQLPTLHLDRGQVDRFTSSTEAEAATLAFIFQYGPQGHAREALFKQMRAACWQADVLNLLDQRDREGLVQRYVVHGPGFLQKSPWIGRIALWNAGHLKPGQLWIDLPVEPALRPLPAPPAP
ncbi:DUF4123 domain-containing protein [Amantichitinum ursilacus]|uniref:DUF4123 domain-containing protein n=1 Tax=Amantichitinum ursilacus TaxID=857265 RepID=A0A0N0GPJ7_9NEIS|nr:DUF4123 domain-containing protein [Amantichitinum ursilacus]KPC53773.1 hypothetical protein WG78_08015 [Amantichitinum ursilacus]